VISRRRFTTGVVIALTPLGSTARAQEYKAQQGEKAIASETVEAACLIGLPCEFRRVAPRQAPTLSMLRIIDDDGAP